MIQQQRDSSGKRVQPEFCRRRPAVNPERPLPSPGWLRHNYPLTARAARTVWQARRQIADLLHGRDPRRLLMVVGPCSIHDPEAALHYARKFRELMDSVCDRLLLVMRTYLEKPRTTTGWTGYVYDPDLDGSGDLRKGLVNSRTLLASITELGVPCAAEILDPRMAPYLADLFSWVAIGSRTSESQVHRQLASGLAVPVGFKNSTDGNVQVAVNAVIAARQPHRTLGISGRGRVVALSTPGNKDCHIVLRGGEQGKNCDADSFARAQGLLAGLTGPRCILVDAAHGNSSKDHTKQRDAFLEALACYAAGNATLLGLSLESNLFPGKQALTGPNCPLRYGVSITDACIGWEETKELVEEAARKVAAMAPRRHDGAA